MKRHPGPERAEQREQKEEQERQLDIAYFSENRKRGKATQIIL